MSRTWIVAGTDDHSRVFYDCLVGPDCRLVNPGDVEGELSAQSASPPDVLLVDTGSFHHPLLSALNNVVESHPTIMTVIVTPYRDGCPPSALPADAVIPRPQSPQELQRALDALSARAAMTVHLAGIQARLQHQIGKLQIVGRSEPMCRLLEGLSETGSRMSTVLISGETGTGKELIAQALHYLSPRSGGPFITVDCGTLSEGLADNELFGHVKGAYTDAAFASKGLVQEAEGGTLFLDEIEALSLTTQAKLLRFLQDRTVKPLGQPSFTKLNVRVVAATNTDLKGLVRQARFREDLYYRISVVPIVVPPLRDRKSDIHLLVRHFARLHSLESGDPPLIPAAILSEWLNHDWPGNVRELENRVQEWLAGGLASQAQESGGALLDSLSLGTFAAARLRSDSQYLRTLLAHTSGNMSAAARIAGIDRTNLRKLLRKHGITPHDYRGDPSRMSR